MSTYDEDVTRGVLRLLADELAERLAEHLAPRLAEIVGDAAEPSSPWLTTLQAIEYTKLPEGTFRKLMATGRIPHHGGRAKLFHRSELDQMLLDFSGIAQENRELRRAP